LYYYHVRNNWFKEVLEKDLCQFGKRKKMTKDDIADIQPKGNVVVQDPPVAQILQPNSQDRKMLSCILAVLQPGIRT
jgi:hypothetical protein